MSCDPSSVARRITAEGIVLAGGGCAILLQLADPRVALGVARHSAFDAHPLRRLDGTLAYLAAIVHGDDDDRAFVRARVGRAHSHVRGDAPEPYDANDPLAQRWVAATLYWSARRVYERAFGPLRDDEAAALLREFRAVGTALRMHAEAWPREVAEFDAWFDGAVADARVHSAAIDAYARLRRPVGAPWWLRATLPLANVVSLGLLPTRIRNVFAPRWGVRHRFASELAWAIMVPVYRVLPRLVRTLPVRVMLRRLRAHRVSAGNAVTRRTAAPSLSRR